MTRDEILEALEDKGWHRLWPVDAIIDALDALNRGPKRVAELEAALLNVIETDRGFTMARRLVLLK
jgi:predicted YcjX-like family ATPase